MKALVIGASGLVGAALVRVLGRSGAEVVGTHRSRPVTDTVSLDVRNREDVWRCVESVRPDVVVWAVNVPGGVDACEARPEVAEALCVEGAKHVAEAAALAGATLVYYSTDYIFDGRSGPYPEDDQPSPINVYGRTVWQSEQAIRALVPRHLILRTSAVFGWDRASRNIAMQVWEHLQAGAPMRVPADQWCNPTLVDYLAEASGRLLQMGAQGIVNVAGKDRLPRSELARALARAMALDADLIVPVPTLELTDSAPRPLQGGLRTERLQRLLGTEPLDLGESLKRFRRQWRTDTYITYRSVAPPTRATDLKHEILDKVREYYGQVHTPPTFVPYKARIQYAGRVFGEGELVSLVESALEFWLTLGPYGDLFEQKMKRFFGSSDFVVVNSGSTANLASVLALMSKQLDNPLRPGDEVITPAVTFPTTVAPLVHSGLVPVFVDCEVGTYNMNPGLIEGAVSEKTRALVVPHTLGNPCDMDVITDLARRYNLYLIEDCCDALGATFRDQLVGTFGDLATLSFFPAHQITTGEGGGIVVNRPGLARIVRSVRDWGRDCWCAPGESNTCGKRFGWQLGDLPKGYDHKYIYSNVGYNFKPTDLQAAVGVAQADRIAEFVERRRRNFLLLYRGLEPYQEYLILPKLDPRSSPSPFGFPITVRNGVSRQELVQWLENSNIETRDIFGGNILKQPGYRDIHARIYGSLEESDRIMRDAFFVGVYPGLTDQMVEFVLERFADFFKRK